MFAKISIEFEITHHRLNNSITVLKHLDDFNDLGINQM